VAAVMPTVMAMMTVPATTPMYFGRRLLRIILDRGSRAGAIERDRLCALGRRGHDEQCANGCKPQNFHHLHQVISFRSSDYRLQRWQESKPGCRDADRKQTADDLNGV
jgi:hypothetical protein